jgi:hypothetical protein
MLEFTNSRSLVAGLWALTVADALAMLVHEHGHHHGWRD